jgi:hypothetical protein
MGAQMSAIMRRAALGWLLCIGVLTPISAAAQAARTTFVPGLGATNDWWRRQNTIGRLWQQVNLVDTLLVNPGTTESISSQSSQIQWVLSSYSGAHVLVGASLGGIVIRDASRNNPGHTAGILTVGTPHQGAPVANNGTQLLAYSADVIAVIATGAGYLAGPAIGALVSVFVNNVLRDAVKGALENVTPVNSAAASDAKTGSPIVTANAQWRDSLPHAAVYGTLDPRFAWMKVTSSALYGTAAPAADWENKYRSTMGIFKKCLIVKWFIILKSTAKACARAYNAMASYDKIWHQYTAGQSASDGWIPNWSSIYPVNAINHPATNFQVFGVDHNALITDQRGINAMADQMLNLLRMSPP